ncbi:MAG: PepSY-associated TM helix domain-containing protein [Acetobacteraceae bacterium]
MSVIRPRAIALWLHRWSGLAMAAFLVVAGLTGTVIAFGEELDAWLNTDLFAAPAGGGDILPAVQLAARVEQADPHIRVRDLPLAPEAGAALVLGVAPRIDPATGRPWRLDFNQVFVDPATGAVIGRRSTAPLGLDRRHLVGTIRALHVSLLAGPAGRAFLGGVAIVWTINCLLGVWLTLPHAPPILAGWLRSWRIRRGGGTRLVLDLHRAGALWFWVVLLALAVSSVHLGLYQQVFRPLVRLFSPLTPSLAERGAPRLRATPAEPHLDLGEAVAAAERESAAHGWGVVPARIRSLPAYGVYSVSLTPDGEDDPPGLGAIRLFIDDSDGHLVTALVPGEGTAGDVFLQLQYPLHSGEIAGLRGRIVIACAGVVVAMLSVTGVLLWWRKRRPISRP